MIQTLQSQGPSVYIPAHLFTNCGNDYYSTYLDMSCKWTAIHVVLMIVLGIQSVLSKC